MSVSVHDRTAQLRQLVENKLASMQLQGWPNELYDPIAYTLKGGGKRMRPIITMLACELFGGKPEQALSAATAIEVFHNFTLLHDDIMDNAPLRRNRPTVHAKWNPDIALLSGDVMFVMSYQLLLESDAATWPKTLPIFNDTAIQVCEGQQHDMNFEQRDDVTINEYVHMISQKTAALLAGSLQIGAIIGGADTAGAQQVHNFGLHLGIAFQLQDDILDVYGDPDKFGKQVGGDILANKKTWLLLKALELAEDGTKEHLQNLIGQTEFDPVKKVARVKELYADLHIREFALAEMERHYQTAMQSMDAIAVPEERKSGLRQIAKSLMVREN